jgi:hypothetical protein
MNANALLALLGDLYAQLAAAQDRIAELEAALAERGKPSENGPIAARSSDEEPARPHASTAH